MNKRLTQSYHSLSPEERAVLLIAATARDDLAGARALLSAAPRRTFTAPDSYTTAVVLHTLISTFLTEQLFRAIHILLVVHAPDEVLDAAENDGVSEVIPLAAQTYLTHLTGWRIFCRRHGIPDSSKVLTFPFPYDKTFDLLEKIFTPLANFRANQDSATGSTDAVGSAESAGSTAAADELAAQERAYAQLLEEQYIAFTKPHSRSNHTSSYDHDLYNDASSSEDTSSPDDSSSPDDT